MATQDNNNIIGLRDLIKANCLILNIPNSIGIRFDVRLEVWSACLIDFGQEDCDQRVVMKAAPAEDPEGALRNLLRQTAHEVNEKLNEDDLDAPAWTLHIKERVKELRSVYKAEAEYRKHYHGLKT